MLAELKKVRFPVESGLLLAFCIFLPLVEVPKNLALLLYIVTWTVNRVRTGDWGGRWGLWDTLAAVWIGSAYLSATFAGLEGGAWGKTGDLATHTLLFWLVVRGGYTERELRWVLGALVASTVVGLAVGYGRLWGGIGKSGTLQLYSVGHVNHTAIYLAIMLGVCASWVFARWHAWSAGRRGFALGVVYLVLASVVVTASRAALGIGFLMALMLAAVWWPRWRGALVGSVVTSIVVWVLLIDLRAPVVVKHMENVAAENVLSFRDGIWRMSLVAWQKYPWFGVGKDNYVLITHERVRAWRIESGKDHDETRYVRFPHAHNLYLNTLVERGATGFAALAALLLAWFAALVVYRPRPADSDFAWLSWGAAASAWIVTAGVGTVNTTFHHEHGLLAVLLLGLWLSTLPALRARRTHRAS